ncbi:MAG: RNA polymerase sigma factor [Candidatus Competibacter sp.]|jgi:RNA polymerase sigma-70 factor (ECF subfamily)|nr:RNA polymerase sigma factor [Candidatus Competibacteraceae bacterium]
MRTDDDADETLMLRYQHGDAGAFARLYERHKGPLYRYLLRQCGQPTVAEELFQDSWLKLIAARASYTVQARFATWLYRIAHNRLVDHYRASARGLPVSYADDCPEWTDIPAPDAVQPENQEERRRQSERLLALLAELPEAQREALLLKEEAGLSLEAIAQATGTGRETVKSRLRYALARLRQGLGGPS